MAGKPWMKLGILFPEENIIRQFPWTSIIRGKLEYKIS
jgi:hypothetical protein